MILDMQNKAFIARIIRLLLGALSLVLIGVAWWGLSRQNEGLVVRQLRQEGVPLRFIAPVGAEDLPSVIVAHGFSVSQQIMLGYGYAIARAGYGALLLDLAGHGSNENILAEDGEPLQESLDVAYQALIDQPEVNPDQIALLGQSMGSGAVMQAGIIHPERYKAVIAVSPTDADVDERAPPNLLLQAGRFEGPFVDNAQELLVRAGGENHDFSAGRARRFVEIPKVEHVTILFSETSQKVAVDWLARSFGVANPAPYNDRRMLWYGLHLVGWLGLATLLGQLTPKSLVSNEVSLGHWRLFIGLLLAPILATIVLGLLSAVTGIDRLLGMLVAGPLAIWLAITGGVWLVTGARPANLRGSSLIGGAFFFGLLWLGAGLMAQYTWFGWFLNSSRLVRWPLFALACLPWKLSVAFAMRGSRNWWRLAWWLIQSALMTAGVIATAFLVPGMFILILMAPVLPVVLAVEMLAGASIEDPWTVGLGSALFFGWIIAALFPLV